LSALRSFALLIFTTEYTVLSSPPDKPPPPRYQGDCLTQFPGLDAGPIHLRTDSTATKTVFGTIGILNTGFHKKKFSLRLYRPILPKSAAAAALAFLTPA